MQAGVMTRARPSPQRPMPRLGFLGVGWIGAHRLESVARAGAARAIVITDASEENARRALERTGSMTGRAERVESFEALLARDLDGIVIATPSGQHAAQAVRALSSGHAVFCQKPLGRTASETRAVVAAARAADRLLEVDFCYRTVAGVTELMRLAHAGELGELYAADLVFHNAYGPDKAWFYDLAQSGGGCVMDLGIHLVDLALWVLGAPRATRVRSRLYAGGHPLAHPASALEDHALVEIDFESGATARLACSWRAHCGCDAVIEASFYGSRGAVSLRNVRGSFYDFTVERLEGTCRRVIAAPPDDWGGRAVCAWARRLAADRRYDGAAERLVEIAELIDRIYGR